MKKQTYVVGNETYETDGCLLIRKTDDVVVRRATKAKRVTDKTLARFVGQKPTVIINLENFAEMVDVWGEKSAALYISADNEPILVLGRDKNRIYITMPMAPDAFEFTVPTPSESGNSSHENT